MLWSVVNIVILSVSRIPTHGVGYVVQYRYETCTEILYPHWGCHHVPVCS
uniref:Uncharacterized protein n=1 Tax=Lotus japonicus TaxID=34305 RepID=I3S065_LOTJA|nr:unknown [Lotus japonicus]